MPAELTAAQLRVLSHPTRLAFLRRLRAQAPATARALGREFDLDSGAASYHLRKLAEGGLIEEDVGHGNRRERWWRPVDRVSLFDPSRHRGDDRMSREYVRAVVLSKADDMQRVAAAVAMSSQEWLTATLFSDHELMLNPAEMEALKQELLALIARYHRQPESASDDAQPVTAHLQLYRQP